MTSALTKFISNLVSNKQCTSIIADCFDNNDRCLRLVARLGFAEISIGEFERLLVCVVRLCSHRILRHRLNTLDWNGKIEPAGAGYQDDAREAVNAYSFGFDSVNCSYAFLAVRTWFVLTQSDRPPFDGLRGPSAR